MSDDAVKVESLNPLIVSNEFWCKPTVLDSLGDVSTYHVLMLGTQQSIVFSSPTKPCKLHTGPFLECESPALRPPTGTELGFELSFKRIQVCPLMVDKSTRAPRLSTWKVKRANRREQEPQPYGTPLE